MPNDLELLEKIERHLARIERYLRPTNTAKRLRLVYKTKDGSIRGLTMLPLKINEDVEVKVQILDAAGNPAKVDADKLEWSLSDNAFGTLEVAADTMSAKFIRNATVGLVKIFVKGDADLGEGVKELVGEGEIDCLSGEAVLVKLDLTAVTRV